MTEPHDVPEEDLGFDPALLPGDEPMEDPDTSPDGELIEPLPSNAAAIIRTIVPIVVGAILTGVGWLTGVLGGWLGTEIPLGEGFEVWLTNTVTVILSSLYYIAARALEKKFPNFPFLGSRKQPVYTPKGSIPVAVVVEEE